MALRLEPEFLTVRDVATLLKLAEKTLYAMAKAGRTPDAKIRGQ